MNCLQRALEQRGGKPLLGAALYFYDPVFLEIAGHLGFDVVWIEMEHAGITFAEAADLCRMAACVGLLTMIRVPDARRESVLKAAECGPDMIDIPMAESPEHIADLVRFAKFAPEGARGFFSVSRALKYGLVDDVPDEQQRLNERLTLMAQIETVDGLQRCDELAAIPGVEIFIGPADLAASMGYPGKTDHPDVLEAAERIVTAAKRNGKRVITACAPKDFIHWTRLGIDLLFVTNDIAALKIGAQSALKSAHDAIAQAAEEAKPVRFATEETV